MIRTLSTNKTKKKANEEVENLSNLAIEVEGS